MELGLAGARVLISGGGVGIGWSTAQAFAREGAAVSLTYLRHPPASHDLATLTSVSGREAVAYRLDATREHDVNAVVASVVDRLGGIDILVNNAGGLIRRQPVVEMSAAHWSEVLSVNLTSAFHLSKAVIPHMSRQGRILNLSSLAGRTGSGKGAVPYATAKAALIGFTKALSRELAPQEITVNAVAPGLILDTPFHETFTPASDQEAILKTIPLGRAGCPDDVAAAILWLCSRPAAFITGAIVDINGGVYGA
jgi:3-oxoacyl-[acyl-carrier protein] reductase